MEEEKWKVIKGYEGLYMISNQGRVKSLNYNHTGKIRILKPGIDTKGYEYVVLVNNGKKKYLIHRLVAQAFVENPMPLFFDQVNHINEDKTDNRAENLEWCDCQYNIDYSQSKPVLQYTLEGEFVREWKSVSEAERQGFDNSTISKCCRGKLKTHKGFIWKYKESVEN